MQESRLCFGIETGMTCMYACICEFNMQFLMKSELTELTLKGRMPGLLSPSLSSPGSHSTWPSKEKAPGYCGRV